MFACHLAVQFTDIRDQNVRTEPWQKLWLCQTFVPRMSSTNFEKNFCEVTHEPQIHAPSGAVDCCCCIHHLLRPRNRPTADSAGHAGTESTHHSGPDRS